MCLDKSQTSDHIKHFPHKGYKEPKYSLKNIIIEEILASSCTCTGLPEGAASCIEIFSIRDVKEIRKEYCYQKDDTIDEHLMYSKLVSYLKENEVANTNQPHCKKYHKVFISYQDKMIDKGSYSIDFKWLLPIILSKTT